MLRGFDIRRNGGTYVVAPEFAFALIDSSIGSLLQATGGARCNRNFGLELR